MIILNALNYILAGGLIAYFIGCMLGEEFEKLEKKEKAKKKNKDSFTRTYRYHGKVIKKEKVNRGRCK